MAGFSFAAAPSFGAQQQQQPTQQTSNLFGQSQTSTGTGGGLFGGVGTGGTSLFGNQSTGPAQPPATAGFAFGAQQQQQQQSGATNTNNAQAGPSSTPGNGLFGSMAQTQGQGQNSSGFTGNNLALGGSTTQAQGGSSLFGGFGGAGGTSNFFGGGGVAGSQQQQQQQPQQSFGFGAGAGGASNQTQTQPVPTFGLGSSTNNNNGNFSQQQQQQQQNPNQLVGTQMFTDEFAKSPMGDAMLKIELAFQQHRRERQLTDPGMLAEELLSDRRAIGLLDANTQTYTHALLTLLKRTRSLSRQSEDAASEYMNFYNVLVAGRASGGKGVGGEGVRRDYVQFFSRLAMDMDEKMKLYQKTLDQIERQIVSLQKDQHLPTAQAIAQAVTNNQRSVISLAAQLADLENKIKELVVHYRREYRRKMNTATDPIETYRTDRGIPRLSVKNGQAGGGFDEELNDLAVM